MQRVADDVGLVAGVVGVEVWWGRRKQLRRLAVWVDTSDAAATLLLPEPGASTPGVGVAGILWTTYQWKKLAWRHLDRIASDPFQSPERRLAALGRARLRAVGAKAQQILLIAYARSEPACEPYLRASADFLRSIVALELARKTTRLQPVVSPEEEIVVTPPPAPLPKRRSFVRKWSGLDDAAPPPGFSLAEVTWTWIGVFLTLLAVSLVAELLRPRPVLIGSFGALMTLQFALPAAPVSQPRNVVFGNLASGIVAVSFSYVDDALLPGWLRVAVVPASAIALMAYLGVLHPPAGAASLIFAGHGSLNGSQMANSRWYFLVCPLLVGNLICIVMATLINNLNHTRQYPTYWAFFAQQQQPSPFSLRKQANLLPTSTTRLSSLQERRTQSKSEERLPFFKRRDDDI